MDAAAVPGPAWAKPPSASRLAAMKMERNDVGREDIGGLAAGMPARTARELRTRTGVKRTEERGCASGRRNTRTQTKMRPSARAANHERVLNFSQTTSINWTLCAKRRPRENACHGPLPAAAGSKTIAQKFTNTDIVRLLGDNHVLRATVTGPSHPRYS